MILDYAHAPDALSNILRTCRTFTKKRLIALFGCGGDRDKGKRPIMGRIGGELADLCILTSDNPRTEDPMEILHEIEEGIKETTGEYVVIENRLDAIRHALEIGGKATSSSCAARVTRRIRRQWASSGRSTRKLSCRSC